MPTRRMAYWIPFGVDPLRQSRDGMRCLVVGRLKPGVLPRRRKRIWMPPPRASPGNRRKLTPVSECAWYLSRTT